MFYNKSAFLSGFFVLFWSLGVNAAVETKTDFSGMEKAVTDYTKSAISDLEKRKGQIGTLMTKKGHDDIVAPMLTTLHSRIEKLQKDIDELKSEALEDNSKIKADLKAIDNVLAAAESIPVQASKSFPMACGNPNALKGFEIHAGILEPSPTGKMVFSKVDEKATGSLRQISLSGNIGLAGKSVSDPVISRTSKDRYVEVHVDTKANNGKGLVMCVSQELDVKKYKKNESKYTK